ncbi:MAG: BMP family protein [Lachnospiraceae bacterium]|nr:BMP family protein [Lachnospiraceae bacterium]MDE7333261.1 BMP family protein [Lachnospiraceae bacterium]
MKKGFNLFLALILAMGIMMGCSNKKTPDAAPAPAEAAGEEAAQEQAGEPVKVVFITANNLGSQAFDDVVWAGIEAGCEKNGYECTPLQGIELSMQADSVAVAIEEGANMVFFASSQEEVFSHDFVSQYPDVIWCDVDGSGGEYAQNLPDNLYVTTYKEQEAAFINGIFAARMSESGQVAQIQGSDSGTMVRFNAGFRAGVLYELGYDPTTVVVGFADVNKGYETAVMLHNQGIDVFACCAAGSNLGVFQAADELGFLACGAADGQFHLMPSVIPASQVKTINKVCEELIDAYAAGNFPYGQSQVRGIAEGGVDLIYTDKNDELLASIPQDVLDYLDEIRAKIISGEIVVPDSAEALDAFTSRAE